MRTPEPSGRYWHFYFEGAVRVHAGSIISNVIEERVLKSVALGDALSCRSHSSALTAAVRLIFPSERKRVRNGGRKTQLVAVAAWM